MVMFTFIIAVLLFAKETTSFVTPVRTNKNGQLYMSLSSGATVLVTGASGLIGSELNERLSKRNVKVRTLTTGKVTARNQFSWNPLRNEIDMDALQGVDAVVHLAGENIASGSLEGPLYIAGKWSDKKKDNILNSRVFGTRLLVQSMQKLAKKPKVLVSASAVGYYGYKDSTTLFDESPERLYFKGDGFLAEVCDQWEQEALRYKTGRTVCVRTGVVLSEKGGFLQKLALLFSTGGGGVIGSGQQALSWVSLDDIVSGIIFALDNDKIAGPINVCSPNPVTNKEFTSALGKVLGRPTFLPFPAFAAQLLFADFGDELLVGGQRASPRTLLSSGFQFADTDIETTMDRLLNQNKPAPSPAPSPRPAAAAPSPPSPVKTPAKTSKTSAAASSAVVAASKAPLAPTTAKASINAVNTPFTFAAKGPATTTIAAKKPSSPPPPPSPPSTNKVVPAAAASKGDGGMFSFLSNAQPQPDVSPKSSSSSAPTSNTSTTTSAPTKPQGQGLVSQGPGQGKASTVKIITLGGVKAPSASRFTAQPSPAKPVATKDVPKSATAAAIVAPTKVTSGTPPATTTAAVTVTDDKAKSNGFFSFLQSSDNVFIDEIDTNNESKSENRWMKDAAKSQGLAPTQSSGKVAAPLSATAMKIKSMADAKEQEDQSKPVSVKVGKKMSGRN